MSSWKQTAGQTGGCRGLLGTQGLVSSRELPDKVLPTSHGRPVASSTKGPQPPSPDPQVWKLPKDGIPSSQPRFSPPTHSPHQRSKLAALKSESNTERLHGDRAETESQRYQAKKQVDTEWKGGGGKQVVLRQLQKSDYKLSDSIQRSLLMLLGVKTTQ